MLLLLFMLYSAAATYTGARMAASEDENTIEDKSLYIVLCSMFWPLYWLLLPAARLGLKHGAKDKEKKLLKAYPTDKLLEAASDILDAEIESIEIIEANNE